MILLKKEGTIHCKRFSLKIANKSCKKGLKYYKFTRKRNKTSYKNIILKDNIATKYIEYKHKNTGTSSCKSIGISQLQCFNSSTKCWKPVSLKPSFRLSVKLWSRFPRLVCFNWATNEVFNSFILEMILWIHDKLDVLMHENIVWEVTILKYKVYKK